MTLPVKLPSFRKAPDQYDATYLDNMFKDLRLYMQLVNTVGPLNATTISGIALPESEDGSDLRQGTFYRDANGFVKVAT